MDTVTRQGPIVFAVAIVALGVQHIVCAWFKEFSGTIFPGETVTAIIPWVPAYAWLAYLTGLVLFAIGFCVAGQIRPRLAAVLLGILFLVFVVFLEARRLIHLGARTTFFETLAICGSALTLAGIYPSDVHHSHPWSVILEWGIKSGRFLFAISAIVFGIDHLLYIPFVASLVPSWIPWHLFWAYFTGIALIAAGLSIGTTWAGRWAGALLGTMFLLWFIILHVPRSLGLSAASGPGAPRNPNEWSSAFIALAMCGGSWICARALSGVSRNQH